MSDDCISRQAVKEQMIKYGFHAPDMTVTEFVEDLPSVTSQPKTGRWVWNNALFNSWTCDNCNISNEKETSFCPNCGAKMVEL